MLKLRFTSLPILARFDTTLPSVIGTDARDYGVGAIHLQQQKNGRLHPVAFISQKFPMAEMNYDIHDKEIVAIVLALHEWIHELKLQ